MGLFSAIFGKAKINVPDQGFWTLLDGYTPTFSSWGGELYESEMSPSSRRAWIEILIVSVRLAPG